MPDWLFNIGISTWMTVKMAAPWILIGLLVSGLLYVYLPTSLVRKAMGGTGFGAVLRAALVGAPLPLCSCGVIPTALYLRKEGAGRGPVLSFLISTPETNVDSVAFTYALMGPVMAIARPVAAVLSAVVAGVGESLLGAPDPHAEGDDCECRLCDARSARNDVHKGGFLGALRYGSIVLMRDLAPWLIIGLGLAGIIGALVPPKFFEENDLGSGVLPMLLMVAIATPMYMCTTASTPVAAALVLKGVSPGAALVFLLMGPATNVATMTTVGRFLGKRSLVIYLGAMIGTSLLLGSGLDYLDSLAAPTNRISAEVAKLGEHSHSSPWLTGIMWGSTVLFLILMANGLRLRAVPYFMAWKSRLGFASPEAAPAGVADACCASGEHDAPQAAHQDACCASGGHEEQKAPPSDACGCDAGSECCGQEPEGPW